MMKAARVAGTSPNHAPTVASSVLHHDIAGRQGHLGAIVELEDHVAGEKDPKSVESVVCMPGSSPSSTCIPGAASGAATASNPGEYDAMTKRCHLRVGIERAPPDCPRSSGRL